MSTKKVNYTKSTVVEGKYRPLLDKYNINRSTYRINLEFFSQMKSSTVEEAFLTFNSFTESVKLQQRAGLTLLLLSAAFFPLNCLGKGLF